MTLMFLIVVKKMKILIMVFWLVLGILMVKLSVIVG